MRNVLFTLLALMAVSCKKTAPLQPPPMPIATYAQDGTTVHAYDFNGFKAFLTHNNDTTYVVNFWATWCAPCVTELPHFEKLNNVYKKDKVKVILVSLDMKKQVVTDLIPFIKKHKIQSQIILLSDPDADSWIGQVDPTWTGAIPATLIYNAQKRAFYERSFSYELLESELQKIKQ